jgi:hypothetical protein
MDRPNVSTVDLWAGLKGFRSYVTLRFLADDNTLLSESEDSDYVDEYEEESENEGVEFRAVEVVDCDEGINRDGSEEERMEDEDVEGLGVRIVDIDDENDNSDLEL